MKTSLPLLVRRAVLAIVALGLWLTLVPCHAGTRGAAVSAVDQLKATQAAMDALEQNPPSVPSDWSHAKDIDQASRGFVAWQNEMFKERQEMAREQWRRFNQRLKVPPPLPPSEPAEEPKMVRLDIPLPLPTDAQLSLSVGEPSVSLSVGAEAKALSFIGASYKAGVSYSAKDNKWLVGDSADFKAAFEAGPATVTGTYQFHSCTWGESKESEGSGGKTGGLELSAELYQVKGALGYNTQNELSLSAGYDFVKTPKAWSKWGAASIGVEGQVSAPVKVEGLTRDSRTLSSRISSSVAKVAKLLTMPVECPYCSAKGQLDCPTCGNTRSVVCPQCNGKLQFTCTRCEGGGELTCNNCDQTGWETCSRCGGSGTLRCYTCKGSGQVTVYESQIESREEPVLVSAGFDSNGNPVYEMRRETHYYTVQVPKIETCSTCGGSGSGGECSTCGGDGKVPCHKCGGSGVIQCPRCHGTGKVNCGKCRGTGKVTCPDCHGKPIRCPLCKGKKELGK